MTRWLVSEAGKRMAVRTYSEKMRSYMLSPWIQTGTVQSWHVGRRRARGLGSRVSGPARERCGRESERALARLESLSLLHHTRRPPHPNPDVAFWISLTRPSCSVLPPSALNLLGLDSRLGFRRARCRVASLHRAPRRLLTVFTAHLRARAGGSIFGHWTGHGVLRGVALALGLASGTWRRWD